MDREQLHPALLLPPPPLVQRAALPTDRPALPCCAVYGLVKFASAGNYIVAFWSDSGGEVCQDLNLPCADIRSVGRAGAGPPRAPLLSHSPTRIPLPAPPRQPAHALAPRAASCASQPPLPSPRARPLLEAHKLPVEKVTGHVITWVKPIITHELLAKGYAVHMSGKPRSRGCCWAAARLLLGPAVPPSAHPGPSL